VTLPDKQRIRSAFSRAATSYDSAATLQRAVCTRLLEALDATLAGTASPGRLLDAGCGTGYGSRLLAGRWPQAAVVAADFSTAMLAAARHQVPADRTFALADIEALPFAGAAFDGWWSSLTVQWCDPGRVLQEAARVLRPGGWLALSTLGSGTYGELRQAFATVDRHRHTLDFAAADRLGELAAAAGFQAIDVRQETLTLHYPDLKTLLGAVKAIGANALGSGRRPGMMGKAAWRALVAAYEAQRTAEGLPTTYDVRLVVARKGGGDGSAARYAKC